MRFLGCPLWANSGHRGTDQLFKGVRREHEPCTTGRLPPTAKDRFTILALGLISRRGSDMDWIRRHIGLGSWAALLALTIQLYLSFGHIHLEDFQAAPTAIAASPQTQSNNPADDDHGPAGHDFCAICAALSLTASSTLPTAAVLAIPVDHPLAWAVDVRTAQRPYGVHLPFQARAPPLSI
jgi:hypothetical protein